MHLSSPSPHQNHIFLQHSLQLFYSITINQQRFLIQQQQQSNPSYHMYPSSILRQSNIAHPHPSTLLQNPPKQNTSHLHTLRYQKCQSPKTDSFIEMQPEKNTFFIDGVNNQDILGFMQKNTKDINLNKGIEKEKSRSMLENEGKEKVRGEKEKRQEEANHFISSMLFKSIVENTMKNKPIKSENSNKLVKGTVIAQPKPLAPEKPLRNPQNKF